jgi:hypothetical protein
MYSVNSLDRNRLHTDCGAKMALSKQTRDLPARIFHLIAMGFITFRHGVFRLCVPLSVPLKLSIGFRLAIQRTVYRIANEF